MFFSYAGALDSVILFKYLCDMTATLPLEIKKAAMFVWER